MINRKLLHETIKECWSKRSSSKWKKTNPSQGQCSVTSLVIYNQFGGDILKTKIHDKWHFYNKIGDRIFDLTSEQFDVPIEYQNVKSSFEEALNDTSQEQYKYLKERFMLAVEAEKHKQNG